MANSDFDGLRVLIIEDESLVAMLLEDTLADIGCDVVGVAATVEEAREKISTLDFDVAILDVNLNGEQTYPIAQLLTDKGISCMFATGYGSGSLPGEFQGVPVLAKPFQQSDLEQALAKIRKDFR